jgi:hypothetical protein
MGPRGPSVGHPQTLTPQVDHQLSFLGSVSVSLVYPLQRSQQRIHLVA